MRISGSNSSHSTCLYLTLSAEVHYGDHGTFDVLSSHNGSVKSLKQRVAERVGVPAERQCLRFQGVRLLDSKRYVDYGIKQGSQLHLAQIGSDPDDLAGAPQKPLHSSPIPKLKKEPPSKGLPRILSPNRSEPQHSQLVLDNKMHASIELSTASKELEQATIAKTNALKRVAEEGLEVENAKRRLARCDQENNQASDRIAKAERAMQQALERMTTALGRRGGQESGSTGTGILDAIQRESEKVKSTSSLSAFGGVSVPPSNAEELFEAMKHEQMF